jgi:hypothetical protein
LKIKNCTTEVRPWRYLKIAQNLLTMMQQKHTHPSPSQTRLIAVTDFFKQCKSGAQDRTEVWLCIKLCVQCIAAILMIYKTCEILNMKLLICIHSLTAGVHKSWAPVHWTTSFCTLVPNIFNTANPWSSNSETTIPCLNQATKKRAILNYLFVKTGI